MTPDAYSPPLDQSPAGTPRAWRALVATEPVEATLSIPGSKSLTSRELVLAALADGESRLVNPLHSRDSERMIEALRALGVGIEHEAGSSEYGDDLVVHGTRELRAQGEIDCGQAGTVMRFVTPLAGLATGDVSFTADESALHRPMGELISAFRDLGVDVADDGRWALPFTVHGHGHIRGGEVRIDASRSSQFVSGLLLSAARFDVGLHLIHTGERLPSVPHIDMTVDALSHRGVRVERPAPGEWVVAAGPIRAKQVAIEPDLSNAAPFLAAALVTGGQVSITGWPPSSTQPGALVPDILHRFGARTARRAGVLTVTGGQRIQGIDMDLSAAGELVPTIVALAALADSPSTLTGIGHIRLHETDRIAALAGNLEALGGEVEQLDDGLRITPRPLHGGTWRTHHDHRMATTGALLGLAVDGIVVDDLTVTGKTLPQFRDLWERMLRGEAAP